MSWLQRFGDLIERFAEGLGGPGLSIIAFFDSSFVSLPEVADVLIVVLVIQDPSLWFYYATLTTVGSVAGCYVLYSLARRGGEAFLRRRFKAGHIDRGLRFFQRFGLLAVTIPSILPPPTPFKIFVLLAGVAQVRPSTFLAAIVIGRGVRYFGEAWLALVYGEQATGYIRDNLPVVMVVVALSVAALAVGWVLWRRFRRAA